MAYTESEAKKLILEAGRKLSEKKLVARTWGNISARISDSAFIITPSGKPYASLTEQDLVTVRIADCSYEGNVKPSSEKKIHAAAYRLRPEANFLIHTHQFYASVISVDGKDTDFAPCAAYGLPGTVRLKNNLETCIQRHPESKSFLMEKHGTLCLGISFEEAFDLADSLEAQAKQLFESRVPFPGFTQVVPVFELPAGAVSGTDVFIQAFCKKKKTLPPYLDDFAQLIGPNARMVKPNAVSVSEGLKNRNGVLVQDGYGICTGPDPDDIDAAFSLLSKNCAAALYANSGKPIAAPEAWLQRTVYLKKYSKQKNS